MAEEASRFRDRGSHCKALTSGRRESPEEAAAHFGWFTAFAGIDAAASSKLTCERLGWRPVQPSLLADLERGGYFAT